MYILVWIDHEFRLFNHQLLVNVVAESFFFFFSLSLSLITLFAVILVDLIRCMNFSFSLFLHMRESLIVLFTVHIKLTTRNELRRDYLLLKYYKWAVNSCVYMITEFSLYIRVSYYIFLLSIFQIKLQFKAQMYWARSNTRKETQKKNNWAH